MPLPLRVGIYFHKKNFLLNTTNTFNVYFTHCYFALQKNKLYTLNWREYIFTRMTKIRKFFLEISLGCLIFFFWLLSSSRRLFFNSSFLLKHTRSDNKVYKLLHDAPLFKTFLEVVFRNVFQYPKHMPLNI